MLRLWYVCEGRSLLNVEMMSKVCIKANLVARVVMLLTARDRLLERG